MSTPLISVSELNRRVRAAVEGTLPLIWVAGEVSNLRRYDSGHWYFTLKDSNAQVDCVMFRSRAAALDWTLADGQQVEARALVTLYEPRGRFQLNVESLRRAGLEICCGGISDWQNFSGSWSKMSLQPSEQKLNFMPCHWL